MRDRLGLEAPQTGHRAQPVFGVIAYGKLGGKELGCGSDLDVVFVYDDADEPTPTARRGLRRLRAQARHRLTLRTAAGELFDIDTALRLIATRACW